MKRRIAIVALLVAAALVYSFREPLKEAAYAMLTRNMFVAADQDDFDPGPAIGSRFPGVQALYQGDPIQLLEPFAGPSGTVLIASRSFDWCPYCMRQMIQLEEYQSEFEAAGIGMVAISYDTPTQQQAFAERFEISIPLLSDIEARSFKTLGILNRDYRPGDPQYGIPHPGIIVINPGGEVVGKLFLEAYSSRVDSAAVLAFARRTLQQ